MMSNAISTGFGISVSPMLIVSPARSGDTMDSSSSSSASAEISC